MKPHRIIIVLALTILLLGCLPPPRPPAISDISESMVKVQAELGIIEEQVDMNAVRAEATQGCAFYERVATPVSERCASFDDYGFCLIKEYLFACLKKCRWFC